MKPLLTTTGHSAIFRTVEQVCDYTRAIEAGSAPTKTPAPAHSKEFSRSLGIVTAGRASFFDAQYRFDRVTSRKSSERPTGEGVAADRTTHQPQFSCAIDAQGTPCRPREQSSVRIGNLQREARYSETTAAPSGTAYDSGKSLYSRVGGLLCSLKLTNQDRLSIREVA